MRTGQLSGRPLYFYSRPCVRGDATVFNIILQGVYFYSRPCVRGDTPVSRMERRQKNFYSRPCVRGDGYMDIPATIPLLFLLTPLREGRHGPQTAGP